MTENVIRQKSSLLYMTGACTFIYMLVPCQCSYYSTACKTAFTIRAGLVNAINVQKQILQTAHTVMIAPPSRLLHKNYDNCQSTSASTDQIPLPGVPSA